MCLVSHGKFTFQRYGMIWYSSKDLQSMNKHKRINYLDTLVLLLFKYEKSTRHVSGLS